MDVHAVPGSPAPRPAPRADRDVIEKLLDKDGKK
jgi:hypothetical protein